MLIDCHGSVLICSENIYKSFFVNPLVYIGEVGACEMYARWMSSIVWLNLQWGVIPYITMTFVKKSESHTCNIHNLDFCALFWIFFFRLIQNIKSFGIFILLLYGTNWFAFCTGDHCSLADVERYVEEKAETAPKQTNCAASPCCFFRGFERRS